MTCHNTNNATECSRYTVESLHYKSSLTGVKMVYVLFQVWAQAYMCGPLSVKGEGGGGGCR